MNDSLDTSNTEQAAANAQGLEVHLRVIELGPVTYRVVTLPERRLSSDAEREAVYEHRSRATARRRAARRASSAPGPSDRRAASRRA